MTVEAIKMQATIISSGKKTGLYGERTFFISSLLVYCPGAIILPLPL